MSVPKEYLDDDPEDSGILQIVVWVERGEPTRFSADRVPVGLARLDLPTFWRHYSNPSPRRRRGAGGERLVILDSTLTPHRGDEIQISATYRPLSGRPTCRAAGRG